MRGSGRKFLARVGALGLLSGLVLLTGGDRGAWTAPPGTGIDPLEILNLQIRANAIVVLDSSGSMGQSLGGSELGGDALGSKFYQAKQVMKQVIQDNERKVSFQFGQYVQPGAPASGGPLPAQMTLPPTGVGRFVYVTDSVQSPSMTTNELIVDLRPPYTFAAAQVIKIRENNSGTTKDCPLAAGRPNLALAVGEALTSCTVGGNAYSAAVDSNNRYRMTLKAGSGTNFEIRWAEMTTTASQPLRLALGGNTTNSGFQTGSVVAANAPPTGPDLRRTNLGGNGQLSTESDTLPDGSTLTFYKIFARRYANGQTLLVRPDGTPCTVIAPAFGTTAVGGTGVAGDEPWIDLQRADDTCTAVTPIEKVRFKFSSVAASTNFVATADDGTWRDAPDTLTCGGYRSLVDLQPCTNNAQFALISPHLQNEIGINPNTRWPVGYAEDATGAVTSEPTRTGMRSGGLTPIAQSLEDIDGTFTNTTWPIIRAYGGGNGPYPKTFVIFLTDGDDTCSSDTTSDFNGDTMALRAAYRAQLLYEAVDTSTQRRAVASSITSFLVAFGSGASATRADWIAYGGSGMVRATTGTGGAIRWASAPTATDVANCSTCQKALIAATAADLGRLLQIAIDQGQTVGVFSDQQSVTESIFELVYKAPGSYNPRDVDLRYKVTVPILLQSTFVMPDFAGRLKAFRRSGGASIQEWDAGDRLFDRVVTNGMGTGLWTFDELRGGSSSTESTMLSSTAKIKRRIFSAARNGVYGVTVANLLDGVQPNRVTLWPPDPAIDPTAFATVGTFDDEMGIAALTFTDLKNEFLACTSAVPADLPTECTAANGPTSGRARKEARQIMLAYMAGAELVKQNNLALRRTTIGKPLQFKARNWMLAESTLAAPAAIGPPPDEVVGRHADEYKNFINAPTNAGVPQNGISMGFGLLKPDNTTLSSNLQLKPVMSVVYHAANDMLHAFRGGPCNEGGNCLSGGAETGGEELWAFLPYDMLPSLRARLQQQKREPHAYVLAAPVRFADVFIPVDDAGGTFSRAVGSTTVTGEGVWRVVLYFGRGIGGKYLTALDVTTPGPYTTHSLATAGPTPLWSRGNPDTQDGLPAGTPNNTAADLAKFKEMGQTWSVPAIAPVKPAENTTSRRPNGTEYVAYLGSGYGENPTGCALSTTAPCEGKTFYTLDALTGDVVASVNVGDRLGTPSPFPNAIVAGPAAYNAERQGYRPDGVNSSFDFSTRVYFNDIHGRVYRVLSATPGTATLFADVNGNSSTSGATEQPLGVPAALVNYTDSSAVGGNGSERPHIYVESGHDSRIFPPDAPSPTTPPFKAWGFVDRDDIPDAAGDGVAGPAKVLFTKPFPTLYRGTAQPAGGFTSSGVARVFFAGTRFNPPGTTNAPPPPPCRSSFDSILFAIGAESGSAAYDLNTTGQDEYIEYKDQKLQSVQVVRGQVVVDRGLGAETAPTPPPGTTIQPSTPGSVFAGLSVPGQYSISNRETPFRAQPPLCH
jgi:hypothetical protein